MSPEAARTSYSICAKVHEATRYYCMRPSSSGPNYHISPSWIEKGVLAPFICGFFFFLFFSKKTSALSQRRAQNKQTGPKDVG
jgi:hypothetical protein